YTYDALKVSLTIERRHEFMAEYSFWYDLTRSGMAKEFLDCEYPIGKGITNRQFEYQSYRELYPIPYLEIITNREIGPENQNPGY
ncbi:MAG: RagB/SusD family nutrient uptake outer membrane protein, partial [Firmicutes bacterium]|nr:RagB/SusD family nutrient uptake outer membrane protein [Bacillota bacterium]